MRQFLQASSISKFLHFSSMFFNFQHCNAFFGGRTKGELRSELLFMPRRCEAKVAYGDQAYIHYKVWKKNATQPDQFENKYFDRSAHDKPYRFPVGMEYVIRGLDEGIIGMCIGEKRVFFIPDHMAYGLTGSKGGGTDETPAGDLKFEVEIYEVTPGHRSPAIFKQMDLDGDKYLTVKEVGKYMRLAYEQRHEEDNSVEHLTEEHEIEWARHIFSTEDKNRDGYISFVEFVGPYHSEF